MSSFGLLRDGYKEDQNGKWIDGPDDHKKPDSGISKGKGSVVVHVAKQMRTTNLKPEEITDGDGDICPYYSIVGSNDLHIKDHYSDSGFIKEGESKESIEFNWNGWIIDASFMSRFEEHLKNLVDKFSPDGRISMALALVKEKQFCINTNNLKRIEEVDRKIKFYTSVFAKFSLLREEHPSIDTNTMMDLLRSYHRITNDNFKKIVTSVEVAGPNTFGIGTSTDDEDLSDQGSMAECQVVDFNESRGVEIGSGSKVVQFFYNDSRSGCKVTFPPVRVSTAQQARQVTALVQHFSGKFASRGVNTENRAPATGVSIAKAELPKEVVKHIRSCFTKKGMRMHRPGRRTHKGVKKNEKVVATTKPIVLSRDDLFAPTSSSAASRNPTENVSAEDYADHFQSLELTPREYFLRSMMPKLNQVDEEGQPQRSSVMEINAKEQMSYLCQEPEKMVDIKSMRKQKKLIVEDDDSSDDTPDEEAFKDSLEAEVFGGGLIPKAFQLKGPRKGRSDRSVGRGGRNECFRKRLEDSQVISGVNYLLDSKNDTLDWL